MCTDNQAIPTSKGDDRDAAIQMRGKAKEALRRLAVAQVLYLVFVVDVSGGEIQPPPDPPTAGREAWEL